MYVCINLSIHPIFLEKFWIHSKIEHKITGFLYILALTYAQLSPLSPSHTGLVHLLSLMNLIDTIIIIQSPSFTLGLTLGGVYSMDFDKCVIEGWHLPLPWYFKYPLSEALPWTLFSSVILLTQPGVGLSEVINLSIWMGLEDKIDFIQLDMSSKHWFFFSMLLFRC